MLIHEWIAAVITLAGLALLVLSELARRWPDTPPAEPWAPSEHHHVGHHRAHAIEGGRHVAA